MGMYVVVSHKIDGQHVVSASQSQHFRGAIAIIGVTRGWHECLLSRPAKAPSQDPQYSSRLPNRRWRPSVPTANVPFRGFSVAVHLG